MISRTFNLYKLNVMEKIIKTAFIFLLSVNVFAQTSIKGKWIVKKVEIGSVLVAENGEAKVSEEFLASVEKENRAFTQGLLEGLGKAMLESEMHFLDKEEYKEINAKSKKTFIGSYKYNEKKNEIKITKQGNTEKMKVRFEDENTITLIKEDPKMGEMLIHLKKS